MEEVHHSAAQSMEEPSDSWESRAAQETAVTKKKRGRRRERTRKTKENPVSQPSTSSDSVTHPSPRQQTKATQTDNRLPEKTTLTTGTQTQFMSTQDKSTQTPGTQMTREPMSSPQAQVAPAPAPAQPPSHHLPQDQSPPSQPGSSQEPPGKPSRPNFKSKMRDPNNLFVLTWNIDGIDPEDMDERFPQLLHYLGRIRPDIVLFQELISPIAEVMDEIMRDYEFIWGNTKSYYTGMGLLKSRVKLLQSSVVNYPTTEMGRNLLMAQLSFSGHPLWVMTSHLESGKIGSQERMNQLRRVWKRMREAPDDHTVIFGGDTNLRDKEVKLLGGVPEGISDVWELLGQPENCRYTWDTVTNSNKDASYMARLRFDRLYIRPGKAGAKVSPVSMKLVGQDRLTCGRFTSDHWGVLCKFSWSHD